MKWIAFGLCLLIPSWVWAQKPMIRDVPFVQQTHTPNFLPTPEANDVRAVAHHDGMTWAATAAGVFFLEGNLWKSPANNAAPAFCLYSTGGNLLVGAWDGLYRVERDTLTRIGLENHPVAAITSLQDVNRSLVYAASPDGIWQAQQRGDGSMTEWNKLDGVWRNTIRALHADTTHLWIGTASGLYRWKRDGSERRAEMWNKPQQIISSNIRALATDAQGKLYVGTSGGIDVFQNDKRVRSFTVSNGLPNRDIRALAFDARGRLWATCRLGAMFWDGKRWNLRHSRRWLPNDDARTVAQIPNGMLVGTAGGVSEIREQMMTLAEKADYYARIVRERHIRPPGLIGPFLMKFPGDLRDGYVMDTDNDGEHTGYYCATESYRYAVTKDPTAYQHAREAFGALEQLNLVTGTRHFIARTMIPRNAEPQNDVNRTFTPQQQAEERAKDLRFKPVEDRWLPSKDGKWLWKRDTSSDEVSGHLFGAWVFYRLAATTEDKARVAAYVDRLVGGLVDNGFDLIDIDGKPTRWGVFSPKRLNDDPDWHEERPNNSMEILTYLRMAAAMTGKARYTQAAQELIFKHGYLQNAHWRDYGIPSEYTHIVDDMNMVTFTGIMTVETDPELRRYFQQGMRDWHKVIARDHVPMYDFVFNAFSGRTVNLEGAAQQLRDWPLDLIEWTVDNREREDVGRDKRPGKDEGMLDRILPRSEMGICPPDQEPYLAVIGNGGQTEDKNDAWPLAYWFGRYYGLISAPMGR